MHITALDPAPTLRGVGAGKLRQAAKDGHVQDYVMVADDGSKVEEMGLRSILAEGVGVDVDDSNGYTALVSRYRSLGQLL
jgi:hypothetical protein